MKRKLISIISLIAMVTLLCGCQIIEPAKKQEPVAKKVSLNVTTTWSGRNIASQNYQKFVNAFTKSTGIDIVDSSETADEAFKQRIIADFQVGDEPDAMYFFTGSDADALIKAGKVVSVDEIREIYPDFASNIQDEAFQVSEHDGKSTAFPPMAIGKLCTSISMYAKRQEWRSRTRIPPGTSLWTSVRRLRKQDISP